MHQGAHVALTADQSGGWLLRRAGGHLVALGPSLGGLSPETLRVAAGEAGLQPLLYKCPPRDAARARRAGWTIRAVAREAWLDPRAWSLDGPDRSGLRRKIRKATAAGLGITLDPAVLPDAEMAELSADWADRHGGERGFSMGRYDPALVRRQRVCLAHVGTRLVGFTTFFWCDGAWSLDLIRSAETAPDGTVASLVAAALAEAKAEGARDFSLAACLEPGLARSLARLGLGRTDGGLSQFKTAFAPQWRTRYAAAPDAPRLWLGLGSVAACVRQPEPFGAYDPLADLLARKDQNGVESERAACDPRRRLFTPAPALTRAERHQLGGLPDDRRAFPDARDP